jgi:hypothetical protein
MYTFKYLTKDGENLEIHSNFLFNHSLNLQAFPLVPVQMNTR